MKSFPDAFALNKPLGRNFKISLAILIITTAIGLTAPVHAQVTNQQWFPEEFLVVDESGCAGEDGIAHVLTHLTIARMPQGFWSLHVNSSGTLTGLESGTESKWLINLSDVFPITPQGSGRNQFIRTEQFRLRIVGQGSVGSFFLTGKLHLVVLDGEPIVNFDSVKTVCNAE